MTEHDYRSTVFLPKTDFPMKAGLAAKEPAILDRWRDERLYDRLRAERAGRKRFILHDGPPYANGDIHMGHAMNKVLKDVIVRSRSMLGFDAPYVPGWDCHGLPIEWKVEEKYRAKKLDKDAVPKPEFRAECRAYAADWVGKQRVQFERLGVMGDWDQPYLTMDFASEATIVSELLKFASSGQLYRGAKPVMWSPVEKTALAEAEVEYADIVSTQIDVAFEIVESAIPELVGAYAVIWTTTPWTIPVNQALAYGPEIGYALVRLIGGVTTSDIPGDWGNDLFSRNLLIAEPLITAFYGRRKVTGLKLDYLWRGKGSDLVGTVARHPMHALGGFFARPRPFLAGDFVTTEQGTGLVHMSPDHGEDDFILCKANGLEPVFAVEGDGKYRADWGWLGGQGSVINAKFNAPDGPICNDLREVGGLLAASADYAHSYPHSWRSHAKLIFRATPQWFIPMDSASTLTAAAQAETDDSGAPLAIQRGENSNGATLREVALDAIERTRWVPARSQNRIRAMVEGRPDWVISRQRAWGVPITLFVDRRTGDYLRDDAVNARIVEAVTAQGADAWWATDPAVFLGAGRDPDNYERVDDILDVWFDSGSTHAFVVEARYGIGTRADLYVEGSDQHRGWFQSSLLESAGTRGRAPYDAVLTHGFALDAQGKKMSKSEGNTTDPLKVVADSGADILRLWVVSTGYFDDVKIGKEVLAGQSDAYRKLRNTFRYLLGALDGWSEAERVPHAEMPELERWVLHRVAELDVELRRHIDGFDFGPMMVALNGFANQDLSAFLFDIRKDSLYCDAPGSLKRRAYRTVLDTLFHVLVKWLAPVLVFTCEEAWATRFPDAGSIHLGEWPVVPVEWRDDELGDKWAKLRILRSLATQAIEPLRKDKVVGTSLQAELDVRAGPEEAALLGSVHFAELAISAQVTVDIVPGDTSVFEVAVRPTELARCERCWRHLPDVVEDSGLCERCTEVVV
ncbi:isoleucine--tRNA ligase [Glacieibacterium sp.]|uniref:isoleucine--tRNA ligase n=1 Tax=Glacieibacterium sp. TaxID=2860237 RepID=UPI003B005D2E